MEGSLVSTVGCWGTAMAATRVIVSSWVMATNWVATTKAGRIMVTATKPGRIMVAATKAGRLIVAATKARRLMIATAIAGRLVVTATAIAGRLLVTASKPRCLRVVATETRGLSLATTKSRSLMVAATKSGGLRRASLVVPTLATLATLPLVRPYEFQPCGFITGIDAAFSLESVVFSESNELF